MNMKRLRKRIILFAMLVAMLPFSAAAKGSFVPSIEDKSGVDVVEIQDGDGKDITSWVVVTAYANRHTLNAMRQQHFVESYNAVEMSALYNQLALAELEYYPDHHEHLVVSDLFYVHEFEDRGLISPPVRLSVNAHLSAHAFVQVYEYVDEDWILLPVTNNGDGTITMAAAQWGPFAIVTEVAEPVPSGPNVPSSPQTGFFHLLPGEVVLIAAAAAVAVLLTRRRAK